MIRTGGPESPPSLAGDHTPYDSKARSADEPDGDLFRPIGPDAICQHRREKGPVVVVRPHVAPRDSGVRFEYQLGQRTCDPLSNKGVNCRGTEYTVVKTGPDLGDILEFWRFYHGRNHRRPAAIEPRCRPPRRRQQQRRSQTIGRGPPQHRYEWLVPEPASARLPQAVESSPALGGASSGETASRIERRLNPKSAFKALDEVHQQLMRRVCRTVWLSDAEVIRFRHHAHLAEVLTR